jgi:hypothetical protein
MPDGSLRRGIGSVNAKGYLIAKIGGRLIRVHRYIYEHVHGPVSSGAQIDHVNGDRLDNRIANLRATSHSQNQQNRASPNINNRVGVKGVCASASGKFRANICVNGRTVCLGTFPNVDDASAAYSKGAARFHTHNPVSRDHIAGLVRVSVEPA